MHNEELRDLCSLAARTQVMNEGGRGMQNAWAREEMRTELWWDILKGKERVQDLDMQGRIMYV